MEIKNNLRFCLVGRGSIGTRHLKNLKSILTNNIISYSAISNKKKDEEFRAKYNIQNFNNLQEVEEFKPDAFVIANPTVKHMETAVIAVNMNSHIFMEKPLSNDLSGQEELRKMLLKKNIIFFLANNFRFHPALIKIKKLIENNEFGDIYFARIMVGQYLPDWHPGEDYSQNYSAKKKLGGGVVLTLQHEIDYAYWLFGKFKSVKSYVKKVSNLEIDVEDLASIIIETKSNQLLEIHLDCLQRPSSRKIHIQGSKGSIDYCFGDQYLRYYNFNKQKYFNILDLRNYDYNQMYIVEMEHFIKCITSGEIPKTGLEEASYVLETCLEIKKEFA